MRTRDKRQYLSPDNANGSFYREPNITGESHSSLAKFKESLKSSRTNHAVEVAQVDLEKEILLLSQSVEELLDEKEKTEDLLRQLEERTRRCQREHQEPTTRQRGTKSQAFTRDLGPRTLRRIKFTGR
jgi:hypothetical protein